MKKKIYSILATASVATAMVFGLTACGNTNEPANNTTTTVDNGGNKNTTTTDNKGNQEQSGADYSKTYQILSENEEGDSVITAAPRTPITSEGIAAAFGGSFGSFVDDVKAKAELFINDDNTYTYKWFVECGTDGENGYFPTYTFTGNIAYKSDVVVQVAAPTHATVEINAYGQFATNEEQVGYFGPVGYKADETTTDCPYVCVAAGSKLLALMSEGVFIVNPKTKDIEAFAAGHVEKKTYQIASENDEGDTVMTPAEGTPLANSSLKAAYGNSFGSFVDDVKSNAYIVTNGTNYAYVLECLCGTAGENGYFPVAATWGTGEETEDGYKVKSNDYALMMVNAYGQFATNEEQIGYFGAVGYVSTSESTSSAASNIKYGQDLLNWFEVGTYDAQWNFTTGSAAEDPEEDTPAEDLGTALMSVADSDNFTTLTFYDSGKVKFACSAYPVLDNTYTYTATTTGLTIKGALENASASVAADGSITITVKANAQVVQTYTISATDVKKVLPVLVVANTDKTDGVLNAETNGFTTMTLTSNGKLNIVCGAYPVLNASFEWKVEEGAIVLVGCPDGSGVEVSADKVVITVVINSSVTQYYVLTLAEYNKIVL